MDYSRMILNKKGERNQWFDTHIKQLKGLFFELKTNDGKNGSENFLVALTTGNSKIVEADISNNPNYDPNYSIDKIVFKYFGKAMHSATGKVNKNELHAVLRSIDFVNSTFAWRNKSGFNAIIDFIINPKNRFWDKVKAYDENLVDEMASLSKRNSKNSRGLISFSSKICRFFNREAFLRDDYYAWDSIVKDHLEYYWDFYVKNSSYKESKIYKELYEIMEKIRNATSSKTNTRFPKIGRFELDQIVWYCYRWAKN